MLCVPILPIAYLLDSEIETTSFLHSSLLHSPTDWVIESLWQIFLFLRFLLHIITGLQTGLTPLVLWLEFGTTQWGSRASSTEQPWKE